MMFLLHVFERGSGLTAFSSVLVTINVVIHPDELAF
jgi:hypothetical protein